MGWVRVGCTQEKRLDISEQRSVQEKTKEGGGGVRKIQGFITAKWNCIFNFIVKSSISVTLTLAIEIRTCPSPYQCLRRRSLGVRACAPPTQNGILDCASSSLEESHRPACAVTR